MCATCDEAVVLFGVGSDLARAIDRIKRPLTEEQIAARDRAMMGLIDYLNARDEDRD
jgi:hypothetical protein